MKISKARLKIILKHLNKAQEEFNKFTHEERMVISDEFTNYWPAHCLLWGIRDIEELIEDNSIGE